MTLQQAFRSRHILYNSSMILLKPMELLKYKTLDITLKLKGYL